MSYQECSTHPTLPELSAGTRITQTDRADLFPPQSLAQLKEDFYLFEKATPEASAEKTSRNRQVDHNPFMSGTSWKEGGGTP